MILPKIVDFPESVLKWGCKVVSVCLLGIGIVVGFTVAVVVAGLLRGYEFAWGEVL